MAPATIIEALAPGLAVQRAYNPNQPRVPAGNGEISGQWTKEEGSPPAPQRSSDAVSAPPKQGTKEPQRTLIADNSTNWLQHLSPIDNAEAAERDGKPFNGVGPNRQHDRAVAESIADFAVNGVTTVAIDKEARVNIPGFPTPRIYDFIARDESTGELVGVEVKSTKFDTIFFNPYQVEKDVAVYKVGGIELQQGRLTSVAYVAACDGCENINFRAAYLHARLLMVGIPFYNRHFIGSEER